MWYARRPQPIAIYDNSGARLEQFCGNDLAGQAEDPADAYDTMKSIYENARRKALRADKAVKDILGQLLLYE